MRDTDKALGYLRSELGRLKRVLAGAELVAAEQYKKRRRKAMQAAAQFDTSNKSCRTEAAFVPPRRLDPDATLWR